MKSIHPDILFSEPIYETTMASIEGIVNLIIRLFCCGFWNGDNEIIMNLFVIGLKLIGSFF